MENYRVMYLRSTDGKPVGCVAMVVDRLEGVARYQLSVLNPADYFDRKVARHLALGRLIEQPQKVSMLKNASMHDVSRLVMTALVASKHTPARACKAAKLWLKSRLSFHDSEV